MGNSVRKLKSTEIHKHYELKEKLGKGSFGVVKRCIRKSDNKVFAVKIIKKSQLNKEELAVVHDEVEIMHKVEHPNCVRLEEIFETSKKLYIVMTILEGGELFDRIVKRGSYSEKEAASLIADVVSAIQYMHSIGVAHRDLKPENLIYQSEAEDSPICITDFGLAKFKENSEAMTTSCGTPGYVAPEVLKEQPYGPEVDLWSTGVILYILLCGFPPFYHESVTKLYRQIMRGEYDFPDPYWTDVSADAKDLVRRLLTVDPKKRATCEEVLSHRWIVSSAPERALNAAHGGMMAQYQARKKLRLAISTVVALNRFLVTIDAHLHNDQ